MADLKRIGVLMVDPTTRYLEDELEKRFDLLKPWTRRPSLSVDEYLAEVAGSVHAAVVSTRSGAGAELIDSLPNLEIVSTFSVGFDRIDLGRCRERGIRVTNTPDVLTDDVADVAVGLALAVLRRICVGDGFVRSGRVVGGWGGGFGNSFSGKSVGIVGLGRIGSAIAKRAKAFGCKINYFSRTPKPQHHPTYTFFPNILKLASNSQILIVACALTDETRHIINRQVIDALGPEGILINIGRGAHIDEPELVAALVEGRLGGAGLDVYEKQPDVPEELLGMENVVLLPYVGSETIETTDGMADLVVKNLEAHFMGKPLLSPVI